jgi:hypothetical protein
LPRSWSRCITARGTKKKKEWKANEGANKERAIASSKGYPAVSGARGKRFNESNGRHSLSKYRSKQN